MVWGCNDYTSPHVFQCFKLVQAILNCQNPFYGLKVLSCIEMLKMRQETTSKFNSNHVLWTNMTYMCLRQIEIWDWRAPCLTRYGQLTTYGVEEFGSGKGLSDPKSLPELYLNLDYSWLIYDFLPVPPQRHVSRETHQYTKCFILKIHLIVYSSSHAHLAMLNWSGLL